jgi:DNA-binding transcriptional LysR family regulator
VKLSAAGRLFLEDARRILRQVSEAAVRAARVARGQSGTLRVGFTENASWRGVVPQSLRRFRERQPDAELQLTPATNLEQIEELRSRRLCVQTCRKPIQNWTMSRSLYRMSNWPSPKGIRW